MGGNFYSASSYVNNSLSAANVTGRRKNESLCADRCGPDIQYISPAQACMASIYSILAPRRLAWPRYTVYQLRAGLHDLDIQYISSAQACMASSKSSPASSRLAGPRRSLRQHQTGLHGPVEVFASFMQACRAPSKSSPAPSRLAGPRRSLRQRQTGMALVSRGAIGVAVSRGGGKKD